MKLVCGVVDCVYNDCGACTSKRTIVLSDTGLCLIKKYD